MDDPTPFGVVVKDPGNKNMLKVNTNADGITAICGAVTMSMWTSGITAIVSGRLDSHQGAADVYGEELAALIEKAFQ